MNSYHDQKQHAIYVFERKWILQMAIKHDCNISEMARSGGLDRTSLYRLMERHRLTRDRLAKLVVPHEAY